MKSNKVNAKSICKISRKNYCRVCKKEMKQIPIRKINSLIIIEEYCPFCDESILHYEKISTAE